MTRLMARIVAMQVKMDSHRVVLPFDAMSMEGAMSASTQEKKLVLKCA